MEKQLAWYCWLLSRMINQRTQKTGHGAKNKIKQNKQTKKNSSLMVVISKGKQWTSPWATSVELREELVWEFGGRTTKSLANLDMGALKFISWLARQC